MKLCPSSYVGAYGALVVIDHKTGRVVGGVDIGVPVTTKGTIQGVQVEPTLGSGDVYSR
jgi:hypothetical protein